MLTFVWARALVLALFGLSLACDRTSEIACENAKCPPGTFIDLSAHSVNDCSASVSGGVSPTTVEGSASGHCFEEGDCKYVCNPPAPCCGGEEWTLSSYRCAVPCASGRVAPLADASASVPSGHTTADAGLVFGPGGFCTPVCIMIPVFLDQPDLGACTELCDGARYWEECGRPTSPYHCLDSDPSLLSAEGSQVDFCQFRQCASADCSDQVTCQTSSDCVGRYTCLGG
ncbi:MAG: hypothetical protein HY791_32785 [Deltaproteobacteria bacterium]|nr:hypothetical protein [Deltaproteobacteria bacterium]